MDELEKLRAANAHLRRELEDTQQRLDEIVEAVLSHAPECWDGDEAAESLAEAFVKKLVADAAKVPHRGEECNCLPESKH